MDLDDFPDRTHVSLWIREYEAFLYAAEDGEDVRLSANVDGRLHAAWAVHRVVRNDTDYVLFQSASYGRYLAINLAQAQADDGDEDGVGYCLPGQSTYDSPEQENVLFQAVMADDDDEDIYLRHFRFGNWCRPADEDAALPGPWPLHWVVEAIPPRPFPPELPHPILVNPPAEVRLSGPVRIGRRGGNFAADTAQAQPVLRRRINYWRADDQGNFNPLHRRVLEHFEGQYVFNLRRVIADELDEADNDITLCVSGGSIGRWTPLVIDLPSDERTMNIVVLKTGSPAAQALVYPNVDEL